MTLFKSPSASVAVTVVIAVWFSSALIDADEVIDGVLSFKLFTFTAIVWVACKVPSLTVTVAV